MSSQTPRATVGSQPLLSVYLADKMAVNEGSGRKIPAFSALMPGPQFSPEQLLLTTLVVKLAVMAALATVLVRTRRFRHMLIFERRAWPDRLAFIINLGVPLAVGVLARLLLQ